MKGGNTSPNPGGNTGIKPPVELMDTSKYVGYIKNVRDCLSNAKAILDNYGFYSYGSYDKVFKLMHELNGVIVNNGDIPVQNYQNAINCIDRHLEAGRPIIVGVSHFKSKNK